MKLILYLFFILFLFHLNGNTQSPIVITQIPQGLQIKNNKKLDTIYGQINSYKLISDTLLYVVLNETYITKEHHLALSICSYKLTIGNLHRKQCTKIREVECLGIEVDIQYDRIVLNYVKNNKSKFKKYTWNRLFKRRKRKIKTKCESIY